MSLSVEDSGGNEQRSGSGVQLRGEVIVAHVDRAKGPVLAVLRQEVGALLVEPLPVHGHGRIEGLLGVDAHDIARKVVLGSLDNGVDVAIYGILDHAGKRGRQHIIGVVLSGIECLAGEVLRVQIAILVGFIPVVDAVVKALGLIGIPIAGASGPVVAVIATAASAAGVPGALAVSATAVGIVGVPTAVVSTEISPGPVVLTLHAHINY